MTYTNLLDNKLRLWIVDQSPAEWCDGYQIRAYTDINECMYEGKSFIGRNELYQIRDKEPYFVDLVKKHIKKAEDDMWSEIRFEEHCKSLAKPLG